MISIKAKQLQINTSMKEIPKKFENWVKQELDTIKDNLVMRNNFKDYELFGKYRLICSPNLVRVFKNTDLEAQFSSKKTAIAWCTASKFRLYDLAHQIAITDQRVEKLANDISVRLAIAEKSKKPEFKQHLLSKLDTKIQKQKLLKKQLKECVNLAKYYQQRGFNNETSRAS